MAKFFTEAEKKAYVQNVICHIECLLFLQVACGLNHTLAVSADGSMVWAFGDGDYGKLGLGNSTAKSSPQVSVVNCQFGLEATNFDIQDYPHDSVLSFVLCSVSGTIQYWESVGLPHGWSSLSSPILSFLFSFRQHSFYSI